MSRLLIGALLALNLAMLLATAVKGEPLTWFSVFYGFTAGWTIWVLVAGWEHA